MFDRKEKLLILSLFFVNFCLIVDFMLVMPLGPKIIRVLEISTQQFSSLVSIYTLGASISGLLAFFFLKKQLRRPQLLRFFIGFSLASTLSFVSNSFEFFLFSRLVTGMLVGFVGVIQLSIVSEFIDLKKRATALGIIMAAFALASIIGVPIGILLANKFSWNTPFLFVFSISIVVWLLVDKALPPLDDSINNMHENNSSELKGLIQSKSGLGLIFFVIFSNFLIVPFLFPSIIINGKITEAELPLIYLVGGLSSIFASVIFGKLSDRFGNKKIFSLAVLISAVSMYFATHIEPAPKWMIMLIVLFYFGSTAGRMVPAMALVTATVSLPLRGRYMSLVTCTQHLAAGIASIVAGFIAKKMGDSHITNLPTLGYLAIAFSIGALVFSTTLKLSSDKEVRNEL